MLSIGLLSLLAASARVNSDILKDIGNNNLEIIRIRLEEEKARRLLLQNDVEVLMLQVEELKRQSDERDKLAVQGNVSLVTHGIAFTATLTAQTTYVSEQTVVFDHIIVNEGNCYDSSTGRFKAPALGLYSFSLSVLSAYAPSVHLVIVKDKEEIGRIYSGNAGTSSGSVTVVTVMKKAQVVYVKKYPGNAETLYGNHWTTFTGMLLDRYE